MATTGTDVEAFGRLHEVEHILEVNRYLVLATATPDGIPWVTPVYFAHAEPATLWWVSRPEARHSRNLTDNPSVAITVFDSSVPLGGASAVYAEARAEQCPAELLTDGIDVYGRCALRDGGDAWDAARLTGSAGFRLYRASVSTLFLLATDEGPERRLPVPLPTSDPPTPGPIDIDGT